MSDCRNKYCGSGIKMCCWACDSRKICPEPCESDFDCPWAEMTPQERERAFYNTRLIVILTLILITIFVSIFYIGWLVHHINAELNEMKTVQMVEPETVATSLGEFKITHYCSCSECCGKSDGITATGTLATEDRTIAVDPNIIPLGSEVIIDGKEYIAEDIGGAIKGNKIDIYVSSHEVALSRGVIHREVLIKR